MCKLSIYIQRFFDLTVLFITPGQIIPQVLGNFPVMDIAHLQRSLENIDSIIIPALKEKTKPRLIHRCKFAPRVTLSMLQRYDDAWSAVEQATRLGIDVDPELAKTIDRLRRE